MPELLLFVVLSAAAWGGVYVVLRAALWSLAWVLRSRAEGTALSLRRFLGDAADDFAEEPWEWLGNSEIRASDEYGPPDC